MDGTRQTAWNVLRGHATRLERQAQQLRELADTLETAKLPKELEPECWDALTQ